MVKKLVLSILLVFLFYITTSTTTWSAVYADIPRPRGVSLDKASLYYPRNDQWWECLDGSKSIKFSYINDDYCDCLDGSDEPGTAACPHGIFHCTNKGHFALDLPSSRVNDGICDCCDASDEYMTKVDGRSYCENKCHELGQAERERRQLEIELHKKGAAKRADMINKGKHLKQERENRRFELEEKRREQEALKKEKEHMKNVAEMAENEALKLFKQATEEQETTDTDESENSLHQEATASFTYYDTNNDGYVDITELQVDISLDQDRNGVVTDKEAKYFLDERDRVDLESFIELSWSRIKPMKMLSQGIFKPPSSTEEKQEKPPSAQTPTDKGRHHDNEFEVDATEDHKDQEESDYDHPETEAEEDEEGLYEGDDKSDDVETNPKYDPQTQHLVDSANEARSAYDDVVRELQNIDNEMKELEKQNAKDYGLNDEYAILGSECYKYKDNEYVYTLCPFEGATQQNSGGGSEITLGRWDEWLTDGINKYAKQKYSHGAPCWNGPQRSVIVQIKCGLENRIVSVTEPNRCVYHFDFETPAACIVAEVEASHRARDEL